MKTSQMLLMSVAASFAIVITGCNEAPSNSQSGDNPAPAVASQSGAAQAPPAASQSSAEQAPPAASVSSAPVVLLKALDAKVVEGAKTVGQCSVDQVSGSQVTDSTSIKKGADVTFIGWSSDEKLNTPAQVTLVLDGAQMYGATMPTGQPRPDVSKFLGSEGLANSGFSAPIDISAAAPGDYKVMVLVQASDGSQLCNTTRHLTISN